MSRGSAEQPDGIPAAAAVVSPAAAATPALSSTAASADVLSLAEVPASTGAEETEPGVLWVVCVQMSFFDYYIFVVFEKSLIYIFNYFWFLHFFALSFCISACVR